MWGKRERAAFRAPVGVPPPSRSRDRTGAGRLLTIGELARATGLPTATLRSWEERHGFPEPIRLASGHRRYPPATVDAVHDVRRRRDGGVRLDVAVEQVRAAGRTRERMAVYARMTQAYPSQPRQRLLKSTLIGLSHAIEDEAAAMAGDAHLFASFQEERFYLSVEDRWKDIARVTASAHVFADFSSEDANGVGPVRVALAEDAPMLSEWILVCDAPDLPVALIAWEPPGQAAEAETDRTFEVIWTVDAVVVRDAARWCAEAAAAAGSRRATELLGGVLAGAPATDRPSPLAVSRLVQRTLHRLEGQHMS
jgi:DICT domain-containing protein